ncbi:hypothetical protein [Stenotrophomonas sp. 24(2023)]|uniref:hypothetical protein n=1 Tax=Stenotrophomonas sp. 24(2023) TaxID=3068324 RepID=UPI0027E18973|nr:hypothetical protein [Stenotrophomonas sp. 24(2023)]WMJ70058.1 hypothetical protein Q9R17_02830 [Stenotrophomonas sp. 24(2023)]
MSSTACAAALAIAACALLQGFNVSLHVQAEASRACLQQHRQEVVCVAWQGAVVESVPNAG